MSFKITKTAILKCAKKKGISSDLPLDSDFIRSICNDLEAQETRANFIRIRTALQRYKKNLRTFRPVKKTRKYNSSEFVVSFKSRRNVDRQSDDTSKPPSVSSLTTVENPQDDFSIDDTFPALNSAFLLSTNQKDNYNENSGSVSTTKSMATTVPLINTKNYHEQDPSSKSATLSSMDSAFSLHEEFQKENASNVSTIDSSPILQPSTSMHHDEHDNSDIVPPLLGRDDPDTELEAPTLKTSEHFSYVSTTPENQVITEIPEQMRTSSNRNVSQSSVKEARKEFNIVLSSSEWQLIKPDPLSRSPKLLGEWTDIVYDKFSKVVPECCLRFVYNRCMRRNSRKRNSSYFVGKAKCMFQECTSFTFQIDSEPGIGQNVEIKVQQNGNIRHTKGEIRKRNLKGTNRQEKIRNIRSDGVSNVFFDAIADMEQKTLDAGNLTQCSSRTVLRKAKSEDKLKGRYSNDITTDLMLRQKHYADVDENNTTCKGYIQSLSVIPFSVVLARGDQLDVFRDLCRQGVGVLHLDATGQVVRKINPKDPKDKRMLFYSLAVNEVDDKPPISVADFLTNDHTSLNIGGFLGKFREMVAKRFSAPILPCRVEVDYSWALINAAMITFNKETNLSYLERSYHILMGGDKKRKPSTVIHICSAHIMKNMSDDAAKVSSDKGLTDFFRYVFALLIASNNIERASTIYRHMCVAFMSKSISDDVRDSIRFLRSEIRELKTSFNVEDLEEDLTDKDEDDLLYDSDDEDGIEVLDKGSLKKCSPFTRHFNKVKEDAMVDVSSMGNVMNTFYKPELVDIVGGIIHIFPLWNGALMNLLGTCPHTRATNSAVENWFKIVKNEILNQEKGMLPGLFIEKMHKSLKGRVRYRNMGKKENIKAPKSVDKIQKEDKAKEMWNKTPKQKVRNTRHDSKYFNSPSKVPTPKLKKPAKSRDVLLANTLTNSANNCWLNSTLQMLKCSSLNCWYDRDQLKDSVLLDMVGDKVQRLRNDFPYHTISLDDLLDVLEQHHELDLEIGRQLDPSEINHTILRELHLSEAFSPMKARFDHKCLRCNKVRRGENEMIYVLQAELAAGDNISVQSCVDEFFKEETLTDSNEVYCGNCRTRCPHDRIPVMITPPSILFLQLKRFDNTLTKVSRRIHLNRCLNLPGQDGNWCIKSVQIHAGRSLLSGHYTTGNIEGDAFYIYDDDQVNKKDIAFLDSTYLQKNAYFLMYEKEPVENRFTDKRPTCVTISSESDSNDTDTEDNVIGKIGPVLLHTSDLKLLEGPHWLNDQILNAYMTLLCEKHNDTVVAIDTFFLETNKRALPNEARYANIVLIPVSSPGHWSLIVVWPQMKQIAHLDPAGEFNHDLVKRVRKIFERDFAVHLSENKNIVKGMSKQCNSYDCGVFVILYAQAVVLGQSLSLDKNLKTARQAITRDLLKGMGSDIKRT